MKTIPTAKFVIAGEGELMAPMRDLAVELGLESHVFFPGRCERIGDLLALSSVCALASTAEGFSNAILEYMAAGRPVVATDVGGAREAIIDQENGFLVPSNDHKAMAAAIVELLNAPERARAMGLRGRQVIEDKFSVEAQLCKTVQLYDRLLEPILRRKSDHAPSITTATRTSPTEPILTRAGTRNKARVLIVAPSLDILGGQAVQAERLLNRLKAEPAVEVSFLPVNPRLPGLLSRLQRIKYIRTVVTSLLYWAQLLWRVRNYDVIHIFSASYLSFVLAPSPAILIARLYGKKILLNYRSGEAADHLMRWGRSAIPLVRLADELVVPSGYLVDVFAKFGLAARAVFNFVETANVECRDRKPLSPVFLSNRNLESLYNVGCLIKAFAVVQRRFPAARLIVAGDGSQRAELESLVYELGLRNVEFVGRVSPDKMPDLLRAADIYLNSSDIDNMPGSIIEAFAWGLPVVTTDAGGIPFIVSDQQNGLIVPRGDHAALARAAIRLLEDGDLADGLITRARDECKKYRWESVRNEWLELYRELAASDRTAALLPAGINPGLSPNDCARLEGESYEG
jgi:glycosyltransferase involved in cell wall biosynthesis